MRLIRAIVLIVSSILILAAIPYPQAPSAGKSAGGDRGRYLVEEVARCWECHTPMIGDGQWDHSRWLQGAAIWFEPVRPMSNWAYLAPALAGLASYGDDDMHKILEKGVGPMGNPMRLPMHAYHLKQDDASAIIAYLRSVKSR